MPREDFAMNSMNAIAEGYPKEHALCGIAHMIFYVGVMLNDIRESMWRMEDAKAAEKPVDLICTEQDRFTEDLVSRHGKYVDKKTAAEIMGVTRATVYAMLDDGRIAGACNGSRVDVRSIGAYFMSNGRLKNARRVKEGAHGADALEEA